MNGFRQLRPARAGSSRAGVVVVAAALLLGGCGSTNPHPAGSYERALAYYEHGKDREAVAALEQFLRRSPADSLAAPAQRLKAQALMKLKEYPVAVVELQILRQEYPNSDYLAEAWFLEGVANFRQVGRLERDITPALTARARFRRLLADFPDAPQAAEARQYLVRISDLVLRKKLGEAEVYMQLNRPAAAGVVLDAVLAAEREGSLRPQVIMRRATAALKAGQPEVAAQALRGLLEQYPDAPQAAEARRSLARLPGGEP